MKHSFEVKLAAVNHYLAYDYFPARSDKAFTPHPERSPFRHHIRRPLQTGAIFLHLPQWLRFM